MNTTVVCLSALGTGSQDVLNQMMVPVINAYLCHCVTGTGSQEVLNQVTVHVIREHLVSLCHRNGISGGPVPVPEISENFCHYVTGTGSLGGVEPDNTCDQ